MNWYLSPTGVLVFGEKTNESMQNVIASLETNSVPYEVFSGEEVNSPADL